jgi:hypothetical protein
VSDNSVLIAISAKHIYISQPKLIRQLFDMGSSERPAGTVDIEEDPQRDG